MSGRKRITKAVRGLNVIKKDNTALIPGKLGVTINGTSSVEVPSKPKKPKVNKPTVPFDPHFQMDMIDDLMNSRGFSGFKRRRK